MTQPCIFRALSALLLICAACGAAADDLRQGALVRGYLQVGAGSALKTIPLPAGDWYVVRFKDTKGRLVDTPSQLDAPKMVAVVLAQREAADLAMLIRLYANIEPISLKWIDDPCKRTDTLYRNVHDSTVWNVKCELINHIVGFATTKEYADVREWADNEGVKIPATALRITLAKITGSEYFRMEVYVNPALRGLDSTQSNWNMSPFHSKRIAKDPRRRKYVDELIAWSDDYMNNLPLPFRAGSEAGVQPQNVSIQAFR
jgi:hypothetical protein